MMNKKVFSFAALLLLNVATVPVMAAKPTPQQQLVERLTKIQKKGYMYGHQDDPFYGISWEWEFGRSDTYDLVGDYPGVMGFDLGGLERGDKANLDSVPFNEIRKEAVKHHERGGIITMSWHPRNPLLGTTAWIEKDIKAYKEAVAALETVGRKDLAAQIDNPQNTVKEILPGGKKHADFMVWLERIGDFLVSLRDSKGNQVPVILRPWHEYNGGWFWWGAANCSAQQYRGLWNMTQDYLAKRETMVDGKAATLGDCVVWSCSPNMEGKHSVAEFEERFPGADRVQLLGEDAYQWGSEQDFINGVTSDLDFLSQYAKDHGILLAMTECGYQNSPDSTWWTRVVKPIVEKYPISYLLPWRNWKAEHFGAAKELKTADDFKAWAADKKFLFVKDIKKIK